MQRLALGLATCVIATACKKSEDTPRSTPPAPDRAEHVEDGAAPRQQQAPPMPAAAAVTELARASNRFGFELWSRASGTGNAAMSPTSISVALAMTWAGARGDTAEEMRALMHVDRDTDRVVETWGQLSRALQDPKRPLALRIANRLFGQESFVFERPFLDTTGTVFGAPLERLDFAANPDAARLRINQWVEERTEKRIQELLGPKTVGPDVKLVLVNAIYFRADWLHPFEPIGTHPAPFWTSASAHTSVPTMHQRGYLRMAAGSVGGQGVHVLELPYQGDDAALLVVLPDQRDGLRAVESALDANALARLGDTLAATDVDVALPKFTIDPPVAMELGEHLQGLGMKLALDADRADLSGIAKPVGNQRLFVRKVIHKAFVKIDEKGTEAAAATAVIAPSGGGSAPPKADEFIADHPFLFVIVDRPSQLILFMGRVVDPK